MTDKLRTVAQQALEALEKFVSNELTVGQRYTNEGQQLLDTITALRERLAQPAEQEQVAWMYTLEYGSTTVDTKVSLHQLRYPFGVCGADYLRANDDGVSYIRETPLYPLAPKREWQGLTEDERNGLGKEAIKFSWNDDYAEAIDFMVGKIETKLKEKNT